PPPRELQLAGDALFPALHTAGTVGVLTEVTMPLVPAREWLEAVVSFDRFDAAAEYTVALSRESPLAQRVTAAEEAPMPLGFTPLRPVFAGGPAGGAVVIHQAAVARPGGGVALRAPGGGARRRLAPVEDAGRRAPAVAELHGLRAPHALEQAAGARRGLPARVLRARAGAGAAPGAPRPLWRARLAGAEVHAVGLPAVAARPAARRAVARGRAGPGAGRADIRGRRHGVLRHDRRNLPEPAHLRARGEWPARRLRARRGLQAPDRPQGPSEPGQDR